MSNIELYDFSLSGCLSSDCSISGELSGQNGMIGDISISNNIPEYIGDHIITPSSKSDIVLNTKDKKLNENITVIKIPYYQTSNTDGGETVYIAEEV